MMDGSEDQVMLKLPLSVQQRVRNFQKALGRPDPLF